MAAPDPAPPEKLAQQGKSSREVSSGGRSPIAEGSQLADASRAVGRVNPDRESERAKARTRRLIVRRVRGG